MQNELSEKGTHSNKSMMLKMFYLQGFVRWTKCIWWVVENNYMPFTVPQQRIFYWGEGGYKLIVLFIGFIYFSFWKWPKWKPLKRRNRVTQKFGVTHFNVKSKYSLFGRTLPISIIMLQWTHKSHKTLWSWNLLQTKSLWITV